MWSYTHIPRVILVTLGATFPSISGAVHLKGEAKAVRCAEILKDVLPKVVDRDKGDAWVGSLSDLQRLMLQIGYHPNFVGQSMEFIRILLSANSPVLKYTRRSLELAESDSKKLLICVLSDCSFKQGDAVHLALKINYDIVSASGLASKLGWLRVQSEKPIQVEQMIGVGRTIGSSTIDFATHFIHECINFSDMRLVGEWIEANEKLIRHNQPADEIFVRYVQRKAKRPQIDEGFLRVLLESRAKSGELFGILNLLPEKERPRFTKEMGTTVIKNILSYGDVARKVLNENGIDQTNVVKMGEKWGDQMIETIGIARYL